MENPTITAGAGARSEESASVVQAMPEPAVDEQKLRDEAVQAEPSLEEIISKGEIHYK